ncbi:hypothetical protein AAC387_Pa11g0155 [Persea americana]
MQSFLLFLLLLLPQLLSARAQPIQTHVCKLNRSPWDVMSFSPPSPQDSSNPSQHQQLHHQGNGISSAASTVSEDSSEGGEEKKKIEVDSRTESQCRKEAKRGHSMSELPAKQMDSPRREYDSTAGTHRRSRGRAASSSDYYYYYSGFGPLWGKTRGGRREERDGSDGGHLEWAPQSSTASTPSPLSSSSDHDNDEEDDGVYRKRSRKPMKSRSLKSIL